MDIRGVISNKSFPYKKSIILIGLSCAQGGITEEQMLKFMGANTCITPLQAKTLLEVFIIVIFTFYFQFHCFSVSVFMLLLKFCLFRMKQLALLM